MTALALVQEQDNAREIEYAAAFEDFWLLYPRRVAKKDAKAAWAKMREADRRASLVACVAWRRVWSMSEPEYLPYPATWLNGERWEDELPVAAQSTHASHVIAKPPENVRGAIPAHVQAVLDKLRAK